MQELLRTLTFKINKYGAYQNFSYLTFHHLSCYCPWSATLEKNFNCEMFRPLFVREKKKTYVTEKERNTT